MKRVGFIYEEMCKIENIIQAIYDASNHKKNKKQVKEILNNIDYYAQEIQQLLISKKYIPSEYNEFKIIEKSGLKERLICSTSFYPDQIIHWSLINAIRPLLMRGMYKYCCGSVKGRGPLYASNKVVESIKIDSKNAKYCLKIDIKKYYQSVDHNLLKQKFRKIIKDKDVLWLIDTIIDSYKMGLPIGTYTSQWFSNFFLQDLDHFLKEDLKIPHVIRYMDDVVLLSSNKRKLRQACHLIDVFLKNKNLKLKENWQVFRVSTTDGRIKGRPIDFAGYKVYKDCRRTIRKRTFKRLRRCILRIANKGLTINRARVFMSYNGFVKHSNSSRIIDKYYSMIDIKKIKKIISEGTKNEENRKSIYCVS